MEKICDQGTHKAKEVRSLPYGTQGKNQCLCFRHFQVEMLLRSRHNKSNPQATQKIIRWDDLQSHHDGIKFKPVTDADKMNAWTVFVQESGVDTAKQTQLLVDFLEDEAMNFDGEKKPESLLAFIEEQNLQDPLAGWSESCYQDHVEERL